MKNKRENNGRFSRIHSLWSLDNFDDGYIDSDSRMRVYLPEHHRASSNGYIMRSIAAYEKYHNNIVTKEFNIHHKDKNKLNDSKDNLIKMLHSDHSSLRRKQDIKCVCNMCKKEFFLPKWRINEGKGKWCSQKCYHLYPRSISHKYNISKGITEFYERSKV